MGRLAQHASLADAVAKRFVAIAEQRAAQQGGIGVGAAAAWSEAGGVVRRVAPPHALALHAAAAGEGSAREYLSRALLRQWRTPPRPPLAPLPPRLPGAAWGGAAATVRAAAQEAHAAADGHPRLVNKWMSRMSAVRQNRARPTDAHRRQR
jgi:hypothetical protein